MSTRNMTKESKRIRRHARVRAKVNGTATSPRLNVFRSLRHMNVQLIDDTVGKTLVSVHTKTVSTDGEAGDRTGKILRAYLAGKAMAVLAKKQGIESIIFDRGGYQYHGRVKAVADGARDGGLSF
jgi:large subunit ribosomal protein L18